MKKRYNKSRLMKEAHRLMKYEGYDRSTALKLAWITERKRAAKEAKEREYEVVNESALNGSIMFDMNILANSLNNYYANNAYNGD